MTYRRVQDSTMMRALAAACVVGLVVAVVGGAPRWVAVTLGIVAVVLAGASRLTVSVESATVTAAFAPGWPRRKISLSDVTAVGTVRNEWWTGWGIRKVPRGWMFNTAGRSAVELELQGGRVFRIGTDDPDGLEVAIHRATHS